MAIVQSTLTRIVEIATYDYSDNQAQSAKPSASHKTKSIASTHARICPRIIMKRTYALIASVKLATKILRELACMSREAPRFLALEPEVFRQQQPTRSFSLPEGAIKLASLPEIYLLALFTATNMV